MISAFGDGSQTLVVPSYRRRRGHPWLLARILWDALLELRTSATMRDFLDQHTSDIHYVNLNTPSILQDLDTPEDYQRFRTA